MTRHRHRAIVRLAILSPWWVLTGCRRRAPSFDILGSYFPAWLFCLLIGILLTVLVRSLLLRLQIVLAAPVLAYPSLAAALTCALWLAFLR